MKDRIRIFDTTLRDGEQSPGATLNVEEKIEIAHQLARLGVDIVEAGFPITSQGDFDAVRLIGQQVKGVSVAGLARALPADIDRAWEALQTAETPRIHVFISASDIHLRHQIRKSRAEVLEMVSAMVARARGYCADVEFSPMDATRAEHAFLFEVLARAIAAGATTLNIPDTVGYTTPDEFHRLIRAIQENVPRIEKAIISVHCHDDLGMAVANSLAAVQAGARQVECTINGIGERAGNASLEEIVMAIKTRPDAYPVETVVDTTQIYKTSRLVSSRTGMIVQPNKAVVGVNAFAHESGIHQDGILKERSTFEIMDAKSVGLVESQLVLGKHSGRHAFKTRLEELGFRLSAEELGRAFLRFKALADKKKDVSDRDLETIVSAEVKPSVDLFRLEHIQVSCGDHLIPTATVQIVTPEGQVVTETSTGTGPVDAVYRAIDRVVKVESRLLEYVVQAVTAGIDALGEVTVRVESGSGRTFTGHSANTDVIVASARAYTSALNRLLVHREQGATPAELAGQRGV